MKSLPDDLDLERLGPALAAGWGLTRAALDYAPVGFGSYHWYVSDQAARRFFVTADDLDHKPWLGATRDASFAGLTTAYGTALALAGECGLDFVVAPTPTDLEEPVLRLTDRYSLAVFPLHDGEAGGFGDVLARAQRDQLVQSLARLHAAAPRSVVPRVDMPLAGRTVLEAALRELDVGWSAGPYGEPARAWLSERAAALGRALARLDALVARTGELERVVTHGEPHAGNVLRVGGRSLLIDWDTVALAPPERDLWLVGGPEVLDAYVDATGHAVSSAALELYRLAWDLSDVASYLAEFRSPHRRTADSDASWSYLVGATWLDNSP